MVYAVIALVSVAIGWLIASYQHAQQKAEQFAEREEMVAQLSAAKQQITQAEHWRAECELLNNEVRSLQSINTSLRRICVKSPRGWKPHSNMRTIKSAR